MFKTANNMTTLPQRSAWDVNHLRVLGLSQGAFVTHTPETPIFNCTAAVVSLALDILECKASCFVLKDITQKTRADSLHNVDLRNLTDPQIEPRIREFLIHIRKSFPHILVTNENCMVYKNGRTTKRDCAGSFNPKTAAVIEVNETLMRRMATFYQALAKKESQKAREQFKTLHLRLSITVAHELIHVYILFLKRQQSQHTPPGVSYGGYGNDQTGESGRYWEWRLFGGVVEMRYTSEDPANRMETIGIRNTHCTQARSIMMPAINGILARDLDRWLERGSLLIESEHKPAGIAKIDAFKWRTHYFECLPAPGKAQKGPTELSESQINRLIGPAMLASPSYSLCGQDLRAFAHEPRTRLRLFRA